MKEELGMLFPSMRKLSGISMCQWKRWQNAKAMRLQHLEKLSVKSREVKVQLTQVIIQIPQALFDYDRDHLPWKTEKASSLAVTQ